MIGGVMTSGALGFIRTRMSRWSRRPEAEGARTTGFRQMPAAGRFFVAGIIAAAAVAMVIGWPRQLGDVTTFAVLLAASSLASGLKLRLPLGTSSSNLSISYTFDFA